MSNVYKPQRQFIIILLTTLMCFRGKVNFRNLSRYSDYNEKTYSRWFRRDFDFIEFNNLSLAEINNNNNILKYFRNASYHKYYQCVTANILDVFDVSY
jgi:hypothetical protein